MKVRIMALRFLVVAGVGLVAGGFIPAVALAAGHGGGDAAGAGADVTTTVPASPTIALPRNQRGFSSAEAEILQELEQRRVNMDRREQALELREKLADLLEQRLASRTGQLEQLKTQIEGMLKNLSGKDDGEVQQLAQMYAAMKPDVAAGVLDRLDNAIVHDVLKKMPVKKSGKIMEQLDPVKARVISELMAQRSLLPQIGKDVSGTAKAAAGKTAAR